METPETEDPTPAPPPSPRKRRLLARVLIGLGLLLVGWLLAAYVILPWLWKHYEHIPAMEDAPKVSLTAQGIPGDPLNVALIGAEADLVASMLKAGYDPADPITLGTSYRIARSVLRRKPYPDAPVSNLYVFGRRQDLAFEKPDGPSAGRRHHVRFWRSNDLGRGGVPLWCGASTYDRSVGLSHLTGQITHHIDADVDAERDRVFADLKKAGRLAQIFQVTGVGATLLGRNGGGDRYYTDGELTVGVLAAIDASDASPESLENPATVQIKDQLWSAIRPLLQSLPGQ